METINYSSSNEIDIRREKIAFLKNKNTVVYKEKFETSHTIEQARWLELGSKVSLAGRIVLKRVMGKFSFIQIRNIQANIQVSFSVNDIGEEAYEFYKKMVDIGDFVGVSGELYETKTGELTVKADKYELLSKALRPLPEKWHGLVDLEAKYRQRYLDLVANEETRKVFLGRSKMIAFIRSYLQEHGFMEVETPILQSAVIGASAKPFYTKHNALNKVLNLRIAPETYLKQVIAGGFDKVFEVARVFRNEGMDTQHLQEFTMVEWYASYWNFEDNIRFFQDFFRKALTHVLGTQKFSFQGAELDFEKEWARVDYTKTLTEILGFDFLEYTNRNELVAKVESTGLFSSKDFEGIKTVGGIIDYIYKRKIRVNIIQPTVLYNYPACLVPLARRNDKDGRLIDMFQVLVSGIELCKAYSELVDPIMQRETLEEQAKAKLEGDDEAMELDEDFVLSMEHGMPPISGLGLGIDRLLTVLFDQPSVRDVVLFPIMR